MRRNSILLGIAACLALVPTPATAQDKGYWRAASSTASAITGDIGLSASRLMLNYMNFPIAEIRTLTTAEVAAAFDADTNVGGNGDLYRLNIPAERQFLRHNTLCGTEDTQWMATFVSGRTLQVAFFSGSTPPQLTVEALSNTTDLCGVFTYSR